MRLTLHTAFAITFFACSNVLASSTDAGMTALFNEVRISYLARLVSVRSVEASYEVKWFQNGVIKSTTTCKYRRSGTKMYHAMTSIQDNGRVGITRESAWNGVTATVRDDPVSFISGANRDDAREGMPFPETAIQAYLGDLLAPPSSDQPLADVVVRECVLARRLDNNRIELRFSNRAKDRTIQFIFLMSEGGWPESGEFIIGGRRAWTLTGASYLRFECDGNTIYFPKTFTNTTYQEGGVEERYQWSVMDDTRINTPVDASAFECKPWPSNTIFNTREERPTRAGLPSWPWHEHAEFPWDGLAREVKAGLLDSRRGAMIEAPRPEKAPRNSWIPIATIATGAFCASLALLRWKRSASRG